MIPPLIIIYFVVERLPAVGDEDPEELPRDDAALPQDVLDHAQRGLTHKHRVVQGLLTWSGLVRAGA